MKKHGPSNHERGRNSPTVRNWKSNLVAVIILGLLAVVVLFFLMRSAM